MRDWDGVGDTVTPTLVVEAVLAWADSVRQKY